MLLRTRAVVALFANALAIASTTLASTACHSGVGSVGAVLARDNPSGALFVREVPRGLAADKAGLLPGDQVLMIDGVYVADLDPKQIRERLRGAIDSTVDLTIVRDGNVMRLRLLRTELKPAPAPAPKEKPAS